MNPVTKPSREEVLDAYSVEPTTDRRTLERYLREFPELATDLIDLSRELDRMSSSADIPLSERDRHLIEAALGSVGTGRADEFAHDPFAGLPVDLQRRAARELGVPRQIVTAFKERRILAPSVPRRFLIALAEALGTTAVALYGFLSAPEPAASEGRSFKSDGKPSTAVAVTFGRALEEAGVSEERRAELMAE